jgi:hypothetical protein
MLEQTRTGFQVAAWVSFVVGLLVFLIETRSTGAAPETFKLTVSLNIVSIGGASLALIAAIALVVLYFGDLKRMLIHR